MPQTGLFIDWQDLKAELEPPGHVKKGTWTSSATQAFLQVLEIQRSRLSSSRQLRR